MTTNDNKKFNTVKFFREIKKRISKKMENMSFEEKKEFIRKVLSGELKEAF